MVLISPSQKKLIPFASVALIILLSQISLGAWTSTNYASLSCPDFPLCHNQQIAMPTDFKEAFKLSSPIGLNYSGGLLSQEARQTIQMTHRLGAMIFTLYMLFFIAWSVPRLKNSQQLLPSIYLILGLLVVQIGLGTVNVIYKLPLVTAVAHNLVAALLLLSLITLIFKLAHTQNEFTRTRK